MEFVFEVEHLAVLPARRENRLTRPAILGQPVVRLTCPTLWVPMWGNQPDALTVLEQQCIFTQQPMWAPTAAQDAG